jgi:hypothetical protein
MRSVIRAFSSSVFVLVASSCANQSPGGLPVSSTPHFTCTAPTKDTDGNDIPAAGDAALKEFRFYLDPTVGSHGIVAPDVSLKHTSNAPICEWQAGSDDISSGPHSLRVTAVNNRGEESRATMPVGFVVP